MLVLLDEDVPQQLVQPLRHLTAQRHDIMHVADSSMRGLKDARLLQTARAKGYEVLVTGDLRQMEDPVETLAIARSRIHHVRYSQRSSGLRGLALALGALLAELPTVLDELKDADGQRLVRIHGLDPTRRRFDVINPATDPPAYWPRKSHRPRGQRRRP